MWPGYVNSRFLSLLVVSFVPWVHAQSKNKTVDDTYVFSSSRLDGIQYGPDWYVEPDGRNRFNNSLHTTTTSMSNLIYFFQGDAIHYYADRDLPHGPAQIFLDGDQKGETVWSNSSGIQFQQLLWSKYNLGPGDHQIVISHAGTTGQYMGLDYLVIESDHGFTPSLAGPAASSIPSEALIVDDNDIARVSYSAGWDTAVQTSQWLAFHFGNTMHRTKTPGASVTFKFTGTAVWYCTDMSPGHGKVNITLNGNQSWVVSGDSTFISAQRALWNATDLPYGEHTVVVTHQDASDVWATLDYFRYLPTQPDSVPVKEENEKASLPIGAIVGGAVGGIVVLVSCGVAYMLVRRRRAAAKRPYFEPKDSTGPPLLNPSPGNVPQTRSPQPAWGYVTEPYHPPAPDALAATDPVPRPLKGEPIQSPDRPIETLVSSPSAASSSWIPIARSEADTMSEDNPPPYVRS